LQGDRNDDNSDQKKKLYHNSHLAYAFIPLAIELLGCLHQQAKDFFHSCANIVWSTKVTNGSPLVIFHAFYKKGVNDVAYNLSHLYIEMCHHCKSKLF
jgi:hypothetical protein